MILGSRSREKAERGARHSCWQRRAEVRGDDNAGAARAADVVVIAVPYANHDAILDEIAESVAGKIVIDAVVPLVPPKVSQVHLPARGSAAVVAQQRLGDGVRVVAAFHNVAAAKLKAGGAVDCDVLGNDRDARPGSPWQPPRDSRIEEVFCERSGGRSPPSVLIGITGLQSSSAGIAHGIPESTMSAVRSGLWAWFR